MNACPKAEHALDQKDDSAIRSMTYGTQRVDHSTSITSAQHLPVWHPASALSGAP
jgi:hypothetical protein